jgi:plastocyanin
MRMAVKAAILALLAVGSLARADDTSVKIDNFTFGPAELTVPVGTTVTWINEDDIPHAIAATDKSFKSKALDTDDKFSFTFTKPGTYEYFCSLHPKMKATVVVDAGGSPKPSP